MIGPGPAEQSPGVLAQDVAQGSLLQPAVSELGQCSRLIAEAGCGLDYRAGDASDCATAVEHSLADEGQLRQMQIASRRLADTTYDRNVLYSRYVQLIEQLAAGAKRPRTSWP